MKRTRNINRKNIEEVVVRKVLKMINVLQIKKEDRPLKLRLVRLWISVTRTWIVAKNVQDQLRWQEAVTGGTIDQDLIELRAVIQDPEPLPVIPEADQKVLLLLYLIKM